MDMLARRGAGEAMAPIAIGVTGNRLWLQDITLRRVFVIDIINSLIKLHMFLLMNILLKMNII